jgi:hypothetical protein
MAKFKPGISGNPSGRPRGAKNVTPTDLRQRLSVFLDGTFDEITKAFNNLEGREKLQYWTKLLEFRLAKQKESEVNLNLERLTDDQVDQIVNALSQSE